jgi:hypothetical protein
VSEHGQRRFTEQTLLALKEVGKDFTAHSIFAPSGSAMWANCAGSLIPNLFADDDVGFEAAEGTVAHGVAEEWLKTGKRPEHRVGDVEHVDGYDVEVTTEMLDYLSEYVNWCQMLPGVHFTERKVDFSDLTPIKKQRGTSDFAACEPRVLRIRDLKYGKGVQVFAKNNTQAILYAYGFFREFDELFDFQEIEIGIGQPRFDHWDTWTISRAELLKWADWLKARAYAAWCSDAERTPSAKACEWCKIKSSCAAHAVYLQKMTDGMFEDLDRPVKADQMDLLMQKLDDGTFELRPLSVGKLTLDQKVKLSKYAGMVKKWFDEIDADIAAEALRGVKVPGKKIVEGRSSRVITNVEQLTEELEFYGLDYDVIRPRGMIGITEIESQLLKIGYKRKQLPMLLKEPLVRKPPGTPTIVDEDDPRPAITNPADNSFENLDEDL